MSEDYIRKDLYEAEKETWFLLVENLEKRLEDLKAFTGWGFGILAAIFGIVSVGLGVLLYLIAKS